MPDIPTSLASFSALLDAQPEPVRQAFNYCLALMMVEAGKARLIETFPGLATPTLPHTARREIQQANLW
jgi:hypothetical protein